MKPLPEAVQRAFPCAPDRLPDRPWHTDMTPAKAAAHDAAYPLPHPGYRAGQVWAAEIGSSRTLLAVSPRGTMVTFVTMIMDPESEPRTSTLDCEELHEAYPYLMADPACPHLAPWSPCEVKP